MVTINKYGWNNITHEVLFTDLTEDRAKNLNISLNVTGLTPSRIAECCRGKTNKYKNYYWGYKDGK